MEEKRKSEIVLKVELDKNNVPLDIKWKASDSEHKELKDCKSFLVSIWDPFEKNALSIHLWTKAMQVDEMNHLYMQTLMNFTDSFQKATGNPMVKKQLNEFLEKFAKDTAEWARSSGQE
ncbi:MAG: gliding motility protein GldC [Chitinophagales bacterium]|nr:gliding motility protein GldC [Chitinophagales bacterium]